MDTLSHGLWGGILFGKRNKKSFWTSFAFGVLPDILVFGPSFVMMFAGIILGEESARFGPPRGPIPSYLHNGYSITHSLIVFAAVFALVWLVRKKPLYEMLAWPAHILLDLPTHSAEFFPTPYLWPLPHPEIDGVSWGHPLIFIPNIILLGALYLWHFVVRPRYRAWKAREIGGIADIQIDKISKQEDH